MKQKEVILDHRRLTVKKLPLKSYADLLKAMKQLPQHLNGLEGLSNEQLLPKLPSIIAECYPDVVRVFTVATELKEEEINNMGLNEATDVFLAIIEVNNYKEVYEKIKKAVGQQTPKK